MLLIRNTLNYFNDLNLWIKSDYSTTKYRSMKENAINIIFTSFDQLI